MDRHIAILDQPVEGRASTHATSSRRVLGPSRRLPLSADVEVLGPHRAHLAVTADPDWDHYRNKLLPRGKELHRGRNGLVVWQLLQAGDDLEQPRTIEFFIHFHREIDRDRYLRDIGSTGLDAEPIEGDLPGIRAYFDAGIDVDLITDITWELHQRAQLTNGEFDGWGCTPVVS